jgi:hypothetical protein
MHPWEADPRLDEARVQRAIQTFEEHGDERGLANAWSTAADLRVDDLRERDEVAAMRRALEHAERGNDTQFQALIRIRLALGLDNTSAHLSEVRTVQEENLAWAEATGSQRVRAASLALAARLAAREGRFDEARSLIEDLVHVLLAAGRPGEAIPAVEELVRLRERKGEPVAAAKARSLLGQLRATAVA